MTTCLDLVVDDPQRWMGVNFHVNNCKAFRGKFSNLHVLASALIAMLPKVLYNRDIKHRCLEWVLIFEGCLFSCNFLVACSCVGNSGDIFLLISVQCL